MTRVAGVYLWKGDECVDLYSDYGDVNMYVDFKDKSVIIRNRVHNKFTDKDEDGVVREWHNLTMYDSAIIVNEA